MKNLAKLNDPYSSIIPCVSNVSIVIRMGKMVCHSNFAHFCSYSLIKGKVQKAALFCIVSKKRNWISRSRRRSVKIQNNSEIGFPVICIRNQKAMEWKRKANGIVINGSWIFHEKSEKKRFHVIKWKIVWISGWILDGMIDQRDELSIEILFELYEREN